MKKLLFLISFITICSSNNAQTDNKIVIGTIDSIYSKILKEERKIWVYVPSRGANDIYARATYPVVYLLDGDGHFSSVVGMIQQLSTVNGNMICPEMIVVGIPNTYRTRDLTPTHALTSSADSASGNISGGGEKFMSFIEHELMPHIDSVYPTQSYRMLIGHSLGGLTVINTLIHHTSLFNSYVCIDPSMWWDKQKLLKESEKLLAERNFQGKSLYLGIANTMQDGMDIKKVQNDTTGNTIHIRSILKLRDFLESNRQDSLKFQSKYYSDDSHGSVPLITEYDALHFIFDYYPLKLTGKDFTDTTTTLVDKFENHFANISKQMGYKVKPLESMINSAGYNALNSRKFKLAERFFRLNITNYPESFNVFDSMGDYYAAIGDKTNAIINYQKSLSIKDFADTRKKLEKLKNK